MVRGDDNIRHRNLWTEEEDKMLVDYVNTHGEGRWNKIPIETGLKRCRKSCRLRWINYLSPNVKRGDFTEDEDDLIIRLHKLLGNRWALIAGRVPGRTDNQVKNHWNTVLSKQLGLTNKKTKTGRDLTCSTYSSTSLQPIVKAKECKETQGISNETCNFNNFFDSFGDVREDNFEVHYESISTPSMMEFFECFPLDPDDWNRLI